MGRKPEAETKAKEEKKEEEAEEDTPFVKQLKEIDDKYLALEREYEAASRKLQIEYEKKQQPFLEERKALLVAKAEEKDNDKGTPSCVGFWKTALKNSSCGELLQEWDEPVLDYLADVTKEHIKEDDSNAGFKLFFHFVENPFFSNDILWKEFHTAEGSPYTGEMDFKDIKVSEIKWKPGKDVTVEKVVKKVKGGGAKKAKQKGKATEEPRESFFRQFFQALKPGMSVDDIEGLDIPMDVDPDELDEDEMMKYMMGEAHEAGCDLRDTVIPFAVRWYTGECKAEEDDDDDEDEEEEEEDSDEDDDDEDDSDDEPKGKGKKGAKKASPKTGPKKSPKTGPADNPKTEECKQQ